MGQSIARPAQDLVVELINRRAAANAVVTVAENRLAEIDLELKRSGDELGQKQNALNALFEKNVVEQCQAEDAERVVRHSLTVRQSVEEFRRRLVESHAHLIAALVLDSFRQLLRKESLISDLSIDADNFTITLLDQTGKLLLPDRLSAGERQLRAVSLLWGLARASGRPLPVVVDTPLGRLDTVHRRRLVENYFPRASHQVLLLSTD